MFMLGNLSGEACGNIIYRSIDHLQTSPDYNNVFRYEGLD